MTEPAIAIESEPEQEFLPAHYYLRIYRLKLAMAEDGTTPLNVPWESFMRQLVTSLSSLRPETPIRLESVEGVARFTNMSNGLLLGEFRLADAPQL